MNNEHPLYKPKMIGDTPIYNPAITAATAIIDLLQLGIFSKTELNWFAKLDKTPLLFCEMQGGKTTVVVAVVDEWIRQCNDDGAAYEVVIIVNISDLDLQSQTEKTFRKSGLYPNDNIKIVHRSGLKKIHLKEGTRRLIVSDECHFALGEFGEFNAFLARHGVDLDRPKSEWKHKNTYVLSVSATPFVQTIKSGKIFKETTKINNDLFEVICLGPTKEYMGVPEMLATGRIIDFKIENIFQYKDKKKIISEGFKKIISLYEENCKKYGVGTFVIRILGKGSDNDLEMLRKYFELVGIPTETFTAKDKNILVAGEAICSPKKLIVFIKGSMRAGKTLENTKNIRGMMDVAANCDTVVQGLVGRSCGYGKADETYPIYTNKSAVENYANYAKQVRAGEEITLIPSGISNKEWKKEGNSSEQEGNSSEQKSDYDIEWEGFSASKEEKAKEENKKEWENHSKWEKKYSYIHDLHTQTERIKLGLGERILNETIGAISEATCWRLTEQGTIKDETWKQLKEKYIDKLGDGCLIVARQVPKKIVYIDPLDAIKPKRLFSVK